MIENTLVRSIDSIIEGLKQDNDNFVEYEKSIGTLLTMGYEPSYVTYIKNKGMEYVPEVNGLLEATTAQVAKVNELWRARGSGDDGGDDGGNTGGGESSGKIPSHVGQVIMSTTLSTASAVAEKYEGTWSAWGAGRMPLAVGGGYYNGQTGGSSTVTLTIDQMPSHDHYLKGYGTTLGGGNVGWRFGGGGTQYSNDLVTNTGGGQAHNNMPPYQALYMWQRTA